MSDFFRRQIQVISDGHIGQVVAARLAPASPRETRAEKVRRAMDGISRGEHRAPEYQIPHPAEYLSDSQRGRGAVTTMEAFVANQREPACIIKLDPRQKKHASTEWSRKLREKVSATKERERHQVLCDPQDEP